MDCTHRLPLRVLPQEDESLLGLLVRLAGRNGYDSASWVAALAGFAIPTDCVSDGPLDALSTLTGLPVDVLERMRVRHEQHNLCRIGPHVVKRDSLYIQRPRVCPRCLAESPHHRLFWLVGSIGVCPTHGVELLRSCPACGKPLCWQTSGLTHCRCGADLREVEGAPADTPQFEAAHLLHAAYSDAPELLPEFLRDRSFGEVLLTIQFLAKVGEPKDKLTGARWWELGDTDQSLEAALAACRHWPDGFHHLLDRWSAAARTRPGRYGLGKEFGCLFTAISHLPHDGWAAPIRAAFRDYVMNRKDIALTARQRKAIGIASGEDVTLAEARKELGAGFNRTKRLVEMLGLNRNAAAGKGMPVVVDGKAVAALGRHRTKLINFQEVVRRFGIARSRVKQLVEAGMIHPVHGATDEGFGRWAFDSLHVDAFLAEFESRVVPPASAGWEAAGFERVRASGWHHGIELKDILLMVLNGRLVPRGIDERERGLKRLVFDMDEWLRLANEIDLAATSSLSIPEAAKRLGLKQQVVYHLAKSGMVETVFGWWGAKWPSA